ncbi:hypothetical protein niasHT_021989 [Heterodera trifolii]|uniref:Uncharacterized protein n=1 Tax=Heterodera trifolii TaxID=157864 RepID=A0ABD2JNA1_9BILA
MFSSRKHSPKWCWPSNSAREVPESRKNSQTALKLIRDGGGKVGGVQLDKVKPFESTWSLGNAGGEKARMRRTETFLRVLKTFAMDGNALEGGAGKTMFGAWGKCKW